MQPGAWVALYRTVIGGYDGFKKAHIVRVQVEQVARNSARSESVTDTRSEFLSSKSTPSNIMVRDATGGHAFRPANEKVDERPNEMRKKYHQHPGYFLAIAQALVGNGVDQHPNPKHEGQDCQRRQQQHQRESYEMN